MNLERLGATDDLRASLAPGLTLARVTVSHRDQYRLITDSGDLDAEPSGSLWYHADTRAAMPVVGDWVGARVINTEQAIVEAVLPRRTLFARRAATSAHRSLLFSTTTASAPLSTAKVR